MNWAFVRREWGAVVFVLTVLIGMIVVPAALILNKPQTTGANTVLVSSPPPSPTPTPSGTASPSVRPTPSPGR